MTHHARLNVIMLATIIVALIFLYFKPYDEQAQEYSISALSSDAVRNMRIVKQHDDIMLSKTSGHWHIVQPIQARADEKRISEMMQFHGAKARQRFPLENLERFGLDRPYVKLYLDDHYFGFGSYVPITNQQYVANDEYVYVISPRYGLVFPADAMDLVSRQLLEPEEIPVKFESDQFVVEFQQPRWHVKSQRSGQPPDEQVLKQWVTSWHTARTEKILLASGMEAGFVDLGRINISLLNNENIALNILHSADQIVFVRLNEKIGYAFPQEVGQRLLTPWP
ncbi:DUF4340 domain-containing protein [Nitrosomonas sp. JL21]|uniref:DUF4340 domain-containing protein n=1 Tax=Nitrosomonas sp. JL21 TaxID=153949 RepID=UPI00137149C2|nr:DUF4340 domain-containing protein [Nitrosomonas sp. JL21]MBL8497986.1 DUF4340 domain-containing protein [Nitrosomonas sp.]MXS78774.1 DUF4340 domain-containing protein [Nitrosomonas sp. JL21]